MRKTIFLFILFSFVFLFTSCKDSEVKSFVDEFFLSVEKSNEKKMLKMYPIMENYKEHISSKKHKITEIEHKSDSVIFVTVTNTDEFDKDDEVVLYILKNKDGMTISNSEGFAEFEDDGMGGLFYKFCYGVGAIKKTDTDFEKYVSTENCRGMIKTMFDNIKADLQQNLVVKTWNWRKMDYIDVLEGQGVVINNSTFNAFGVKISANFYDSAGNLLMFRVKELGDIASNYQSSFDFSYIDYTKRPTRSDVTINFDEDRVLEAILNSDWNGTEYDEYMKHIQSLPIVE